MIEDDEFSESPSINQQPDCEVAEHIDEFPSSSFRLSYDQMSPEFQIDQSPDSPHDIYAHNNLENVMNLETCHQESSAMKTAVIGQLNQGDEHRKPRVTTDDSQSQYPVLQHWSSKLPPTLRNVYENEKRRFNLGEEPQPPLQTSPLRDLVKSLHAKTGSVIKFSY